MVVAVGASGIEGNRVTTCLSSFDVTRPHCIVWKGARSVQVFLAFSKLPPVIVIFQKC
jgi:hypothetical protein